MNRRYSYLRYYLLLLQKTKQTTIYPSFNSHIHTFILLDQRDEKVWQGLSPQKKLNRSGIVILILKFVTKLLSPTVVSWSSPPYRLIQSPSTTLISEPRLTRKRLLSRRLS